MSETHSYPRLLFFNITHRCNLHCVHCAVSSYCYLDNKNELTLKEIEEVAKQFYDIGGEKVCFAGGEPLLREDIFEIISCFSSLGITTFLETNATLITKKVAKRLKNSGLNFMATSIDGIGNTHDEFRREIGAFKKTIEGINNALNEGIYTVINTTVYSKNYKEVVEMVKMSKKLKVPIRLTPVCLIGRGKNLRGETLEPTKIKKLIDFVYLLRKRNIRVGINLPPALLPIEIATDGVECGWAEELFGITPNGDVSICPIAYHNKEFIAGNVKEKTLKEIWVNSERIKGFKKLRENIEKN